MKIHSLTSTTDSEWRQPGALLKPITHKAAPARTGWRRLLATDAQVAPAIARLALGAAILPHGAQKLFGWFGGHGFANTMHWFTETMQIPWIFGFAAIVAETLGGVALIVGAASRLAALAVGAIYVVAIATVHGQHGFFMNWFGNQKGEGWEYFLLGLALVAIVAIAGGGAWSLDRAVAGKSSKAKSM